MTVRADSPEELARARAAGVRWTAQIYGHGETASGWQPAPTTPACCYRAA
jgi:hypothetical protein